MTCDDQRPCSRCLKRGIGHLCHDEVRSRRSSTEPSGVEPSGAPQQESGNQYPDNPGAENSGLEYNTINDFMTMINDDALFLQYDLGSPYAVKTEQQHAVPMQVDPASQHLTPMKNEAGLALNAQVQAMDLHSTPQLQFSQQKPSDSPAVDQFMLTAADPEHTSAEGRLKQVISAKHKAGLMRPYNYADGYDRLRVYMDSYMNAQSKQRILDSLSVVRPAFRAVAKSLNDIDLVKVEENFERMLLNYDWMFSATAMPACLWRRTGEIYRGNREFAELVECSVDDLRDGRLTIYELMTEESTVSYWEKYANVAFSSEQKAVLTSCNIRTRDGRKRRLCSFSFTIRRDWYNIPSCIVGNFIPIPQR